MNPSVPSTLRPSLEHFLPAWFVPVMGWCGLSMAWLRAQPMLGESVLIWAQGAAGFAWSVFVLVLLAHIWRYKQHPQAVQADLRHPVRHAVYAALPVSMILLATTLVALLGTGTPGAAALWWAGALLEFAATVWVVSRWLRPKEQGGLQWPALTPMLFIPVVGNVVAPLAGVPMGYEAWSAAQMALGVFLWPVVLTLIVTRLAQAGPLPGRLSPTWFILAAPPSVIGLDLLQWQAPELTAWACWGLALFSLLWALTQVGVMRAQSFGLPHWGMSFPLAAFTALSLRLSQTPQGNWLQMPALLLLAISTVVVAGLTVSSYRGLRNGSLLAPET